MKTIEIVTHCWAGRYAHYAYALTYQLSSLVLHPSRNLFQVTVCCCDEDNLVSDVLDFFWDKLRLNVHDVELPQLGRRSIGRNEAALNTSADIVWFTDCDHVFGEGCLNDLAKMNWPEWAPMIFPKTIQIHKDWNTGDRTLSKAVNPVLVDVDPSEFTPKKYNRAIGGVQIVCGDYCREHGYLADSDRWQKPYMGARGFDSCKCDRAFRRAIEDHGGSIIPIELPNLFRLRHTQTTHHD